MKLVPLLRFWQKRPKPRDENDLLDELTEDALQFLKEQESEESVEESVDEDSQEDEEEEEEKTEETDESAGADTSRPARDDLLNVFLAAEEEYADTLALASEVEEVSAAELLAELRGVASALNLPSSRRDAG